MSKTILEKYAELLVHYCLEIQPGDRFFISTTTLAEPLVREIYRVATRAGAHIKINMEFVEQQKIFLEEANNQQLDYVDPESIRTMEDYDAYLVIRAPFNLRENQNNDPIKSERRNKALDVVHQIYSDRISDRRLKRCLCQYPTQASAQLAGMSLSEYEHFVFNACNLYADDPEKEWLKVRESQQKVADYLNDCSHIRYVGPKTDIEFSVKGRTWINSDGQTNMPSGEVYTGPVENSINGTVHFDFPTMYSGKVVENITLEVKNGQVISWKADRGQEVLDDVFKIEGARYFGEAAIGTNYNIQKSTGNILFDEKIGGSIHMAVGQSYKQTGGTNQSPIHWDMISNMKIDGEIWADGKLIYKNGHFII